MLKWVKNIFKKKRDLRAECIAAYGYDFGEMYDTICRGTPIGGFKETLIFLDMVEAVRNHDTEKISKIKQAMEG